MWTFYIGQTRNSPPGECRQTLEQAKEELPSQAAGSRKGR